MKDSEALEIYKQTLQLIRDSTFRNALTLRGIAAQGLDKVAAATLKEKKHTDYDLQKEEKRFRRNGHQEG